jgi:monovalent cation:H+ antiporter-2, CPA2 family
MIAESKKGEVIEHTLLSTRDLLMPVFFLYFGTTIVLSEGVPMLGLLVILLLWSVIAKILVGIMGGRLYGLSKRNSLRAGLSLTARGEFSVIVASLTVGVVKIFGGVFILISAIIGILLFMLAPRITSKIYPKKKKDRPTLEDLKQISR